MTARPPAPGPPAAAVAPGAPIRPLTALRFFAALWVVVYDYWPNLGAGPAPALLARGYLGVELFFVLSGFILCHVYLPGFAAGRFRYGAFLQARLARIYPLHLATLAGVGAMGLAALAAGRGIDPNILSLPALAANLLLVHAWGFAPVAGWNHPSWSISAEWFAYLAFPAFAWAAVRLAGRPWTAVCGAASLLVLLYGLFPALAGFPLTQATIAWGALRIVPCFALGCALHLAGRKGAVQGRTAGLGAAFFGAAVLVAGQVSAPDAVIVLMFGGLILSLALIRSSADPSVASHVFVYLGEISYSIYMLCIPWQLFFTNAWSRMDSGSKAHMPLIVWICFLIAIIPLSALTHRWIEQPARALLRRPLAPPPALRQAWLSRNAAE